MKDYENLESKKQRCVLYATIASILNILLFIGVMLVVFLYVYEINPLEPRDKDEKQEEVSSDSAPAAMFTYSVDKNSSIDGVTYSVNMTLIDSSDRLIDYMEQAADLNSNLSFSARYFSGLGFYITEINGLQESFSDQLAWFIMKVEAMGACLLPVGVSSYTPMAGDHIIMQFDHYAIYNTTDYCQLDDA